MKLPLTDQEFTQFALMFAGNEKSLLAHAFNKKDSARLRGRIVEWIRCIAYFRPDLMRFETGSGDDFSLESSRPGTRIFIANVWISTTQHPVRSVDEFLRRPDKS